MSESGSRQSVPRLNSQRSNININANRGKTRLEDSDSDRVKELEHLKAELVSLKEMLSMKMELFDLKSQYLDEEMKMTKASLKQNSYAASQKEVNEVMDYMGLDTARKAVSVPVYGASEESRLPGNKGIISEDFGKTKMENKMNEATARGQSQVNVIDELVNELVAQGSAPETILNVVKMSRGQGSSNLSEAPQKVERIGEQVTGSRPPVARPQESQLVKPFFSETSAEEAAIFRKAGKKMYMSGVNLPKLKEVKAETVSAFLKEFEKTKNSYETNFFVSDLPLFGCLEPQVLTALEKYGLVGTDDKEVRAALDRVVQEGMETRKYNIYPNIRASLEWKEEGSISESMRLFLQKAENMLEGIALDEETEERACLAIITKLPAVFLPEVPKTKQNLEKWTTVKKMFKDLRSFANTMDHLNINGSGKERKRKDVDTKDNIEKSQADVEPNTKGKVWFRNRKNGSRSPFLSSEEFSRRKAADECVPCGSKHHNSFNCPEYEAMLGDAVLKKEDKNNPEKKTYKSAFVGTVEKVIAANNENWHPKYGIFTNNLSADAVT